MLVPRAGFLISVHRPGDSAILENLRTRERKQINDLAEVAAHVERWLSEAPDDAGDADPAA